MEWVHNAPLALCERLSSEVAKKGGGPQHLLFLQLSPQAQSLIAGVARLIVRKVPTFPVTVDYGLSIKTMIDLGEYEKGPPSDIPSSSLKLWRGKMERTLYLINLGRKASTEDVLDEMKRRKLRPAFVEELLAFGAQYPEVQCQVTVVALSFLPEEEGLVLQDYSGHRVLWTRRAGTEEDQMTEKWASQTCFLGAPI